MTTYRATYVVYVSLVLLAVHANNIWSNYLMVYLYAVSDDGYDDDDTKCFISMADATGISTTEYGVLVGYGFTVTFVLFNLIIGRAVDLYNRKMILFCCLLVWSFATMCQGLSNNYTQLLLTRILNGAGQSGNMPTTLSLIADFVPAEHLAQANGVNIAGFYIGAGLGSLCIAMAEAIGWRATCYSVAGCGFFLAFIWLFTVKEPARVILANTLTTPPVDSVETGQNGQGTRDPEEDRVYTLKQSLAIVFGEPLFVLIIVAGMLRHAAAFVIMAYLPDFYSNIYPDDNTAYSFLNAGVVCIGGAVSSYVGGCAADRWEKSGEKKARMFIPAIGMLLGVPTFYMVIVIPSFYASMFLLFVEYLFAECWYGPSVSVLQTYLPPRVRGVGIGCYICSIMVSGSSATSVAGLVLDTYTSDDALKRVLIVSVCGMYVASAMVYLAASCFMPELNSGPFNRGEKEALLRNGNDELETDSYGTDSRPKTYDSDRKRGSERKMT